MKLEEVVPWGRSKDEYVRMFGLTSWDLGGARILDCAGGPSSFNAEVTAEGGEVVSCDPIYRFSAAQISGRVEEVFEGLVRAAREGSEGFVWREFASPQHLGEHRLATVRRFVEDFPRGFREGRYVEAGLPVLPFEAGAFDLALCSHLLFTYSGAFSMEFHLASVLEMCRVAGEARVFPLLASSVHRGGGAGERSPHLGPVVEGLGERGYEARVEVVPYEFQKGGNEMLRVRRKGDGGGAA